MTDGADLLAAVLANPDDDTVRLVYADWLQEHGDEARAEFIRVQIELARNDVLARGACSVCGKVTGERHAPKCEWPQRWNALRRREKAFTHATERGSAHDWSICRCCDWHAPIPHGGWEWEFRRGFVESVTCTAADWLEHEREILAQHPVRRVRLTTLPTAHVPDFNALRLWRKPLDWGADLLWSLEAEWPEIVFELPSNYAAPAL